jgi:hypothetical protein
MGMAEGPCSPQIAENSGDQAQHMPDMHSCMSEQRRLLGSSSPNKQQTNPLSALGVNFTYIVVNFWAILSPH